MGDDEDASSEVAEVDGGDEKVTKLKSQNDEVASSEVADPANRVQFTGNIELPILSYNFFVSILLITVNANFLIYTCYVLYLQYRKISHPSSETMSKHGRRRSRVFGGCRSDGRDGGDVETTEVADPANRPSLREISNSHYNFFVSILPIK